MRKNGKYKIGSYYIRVPNEEAYSGRGLEEGGLLPVELPNLIRGLVALRCENGVNRRNRNETDETAMTQPETAMKVNEPNRTRNATERTLNS